MNSFNSQAEALDLNKITTTEDLLAKLRAGNNQKLEIGLGELKVPCRLLSAAEEATLIVKSAQAAAAQNPTGIQKEVFEAQITMKQMLLAATTVQGVPGLTKDLLDMISHTELNDLFNQYNTLNHTINPNLQTLTQAEILAIVEDVKKKTKTSRDFYTYQLAEIGRFFLDMVIPTLLTANEHGTQS